MQPPFEGGLVITSKVRVPKIDYPSLPAFRSSGDALTAGIDERVIDGVLVHLINDDRTAANCFKCRKKIGISLCRTGHAKRRPACREER